VTPEPRHAARPTQDVLRDEGARQDGIGADGAGPRCPVRKLTPPDEPTGPALEHRRTAAGSHWVVRNFFVARQVLRDADALVQAGFGADRVASAAKMRPPILYLEGASHRAQRKAAARLFAPAVTEGYRDMMQSLSDRLVGRIRPDRSVDLSVLSLEMAVEVAARVVGLTNSSRAGMTRRLNTFFEGDPISVRLTPRNLIKVVRAQSATLRFYWLDVKPAIRARRKEPGDDVISQLLEQGFSDLEVLTECLTYGAAGMVTTREFITVAAWHLLDDPDLLARYRSSDAGGRLALLNETLRLEPVVGHLFRRTTAPVTLNGPDGEVTVPAGGLIDLDLRAINADPATVGAGPLDLCPGRELPRAVPPTVMSFGDGNHRCPGAALAIMETDIFLSTLFGQEILPDGPPTVRWNAVSQGYDLDAFLIRRA
jgi:cytochrome P450